MNVDVSTPQNEHPQSVNNFGCCILYIPRAMLRLVPISKGLAASIGNMVNVIVATPKNECQLSVNTVSTERQQSINRASTQCQQSVNDFGCCMLSNPRGVLWHLPIIEVLATCMGNYVSVDIATPKNVSQQRINRASMISGVASCIIQGLCYGIDA